MKLPEDLLSAYIDGQLDAAESARVAQAIAADPRLQADVARAAALRARLQQAYAPALEEPVPAHLLRAARGEAAAADAGVVPLRAAGRNRPEARRNWGLPHWAAVAASLALGLLLAPLLPTTDTRGVDLAHGLPLAAGALSDALEHQLASDPAAGGLRMGLSFRSRQGGYCRTFSAASPAPVAGLACRAADGWRVTALGTAPPAQGELRQASTTTPPAILAEVEARLAGDVLDTQGEQAARAAGWR